MRKKEKHFVFFENKQIFQNEVNKNHRRLHRKKGVEKNQCSFLKGLKTAYLTVPLSQFRRFERKRTLFECGRLKTPLYVFLDYV